MAHKLLFLSLMKAVTIHGSKKISVDNHPDPTIEQPRDAIVRVTATAICGSDLHIYNGMLPQPRPMVLGHEFMGIVEEVGAGVKSLKRGDRVVVPFPIACGECFFCTHHEPPQCERSNKNYGPEGGLLKEKGAALFGYTDLYGGYDGGQAQFVRVPFADHGPRKVPAELTDEEVLFLSDIIPTGYSGLKWANLQPGETVAVFGCGPVGLMTQKLAHAMGAEKVIGVDILPYRLAAAARTAGSITINGKENDPVKAIRDLTDGRGADVVIDAVGMEAHRSTLEKVSEVARLQAGTIDVVKKCLSAVRRAGRVSLLGVYGSTYGDFPLGQIVDKGIQLRSSQAQVHEFIDELMQMIVTKKIVGNDIISHRLPIDKAAHAYQVFNDKKEECVKVVLDPWA